MDNQSVTPRSAKLLTIDLGADLKSSWFQWCAERQLVPGKALKSLLEQTLKHGLGAAEMPSPPVPAVKVGASPDARSKVVYKAYTPPLSRRKNGSFAHRLSQSLVMRFTSLPPNITPC